MKRRRSRFAVIVLLIVAALVAASVIRAARGRTPHGLTGEVKRLDGRLLYFDGQRWTSTPTAAQIDMPF